MKNNYNSININCQLVLSAEAGQTEIVQQQIKKGADVNYTSELGRTVLIYAAGEGHVETVRYLLEAGALVDKTDSNGRTALMWAAQGGHVETVKCLLEYGANVDHVDTVGLTALSFAAHKGHTAIAKDLIELGASVDKGNTKGKTALMWAAQEGHTETVRYLHENGAAVDQVDSDGKTTIMLAAVGGHIETVRYLHENGVAVDQVGYNNETALMAAAVEGHTEIAAYLLKAGATVDQVDHSGDTALMCASVGGYKETVKYLLESGASIDKGNAKGRTALMWAAEEGHAATVRCLLESGAKVDQVDHDGDTALILATQGGYLETVKCLRGAGATVDQFGKEMTALMCAAENGHTEIVECLLEAGAKVNATSMPFGSTALHRASMKGHTSVIQLLLDHRADIQATDIHKIDPLCFAVAYGHECSAELLIQRGAKLNRVSRIAENTLLMEAAVNGQTNMVKFLMARGLKVDAVGKEGQSALMMASGKGYNNTVEFIIAQGVEVDRIDKQGRTALHWAAQAGHVETVRTLLQSSYPRLKKAFETELSREVKFQALRVKKVTIEVTGEPLQACAEHLVQCMARSSKASVDAAIKSFKAQYKGQLKQYISEFNGIRCDKRQGTVKVSATLDITLDLSQGKLSIMSNLKDILDQAARQIQERQEEEQARQEKIAREGAWKRSGVSVIELDEGGAILCDKDIQLNGGCYIDAGYFISRLEQMGIQSISDDIVKKSETIHALTQDLILEQEGFKKGFNELIQSIVQHDSKMQKFVSSVNDFLVKSPDALDWGKLGGSLVNKQARLKADADCLQQCLLKELGYLLFKINTSGALMVQESGQEWGLGSAYIEETQEKVLELVAKYDKAKRIAIECLQTKLKEVSEYELKKCGSQIVEYSLDAESPEPLDESVKRVVQLVKKLSDKCKSVRDTDLGLLASHDTLETLGLRLQSLIQLIKAKKDLKMHMVPSTIGRLERFRGIINCYDEISSEFEYAQSEFEGAKKSLPRDLRGYWDKFDFFKTLQQNLNCTKWISRIRYLTKIGMASEPKVLRAEELKKQVMSIAGGAKPATSVAGAITIDATQVECLKSIEAAARDANCVEVKRALVRHYVGVLQVRGFVNESMTHVHDVLAHQLQFYTEEDSELIDNMVKCIISSRDYTSCMDGLVVLVQNAGIGRLQKSDEKVFWDSLIKSGKTPEEIFKQALEILRQPIVVNRVKGRSESVVDSYCRVDALFTLAKLWQTAPNRSLLLRSVSVHNCLDVEGEINEYVQMRNDLRHNPELICQDIETIYEQLFVHLSESLKLC